MNNEVTAIGEITSYRLREALVYIFVKSPNQEMTLVDIGGAVLRYFWMDNAVIPEKDLLAFRRRLQDALAEKVRTGFISVRRVKNSVIKNYMLYQLVRP